MGVTVPVFQQFNGGIATSEVLVRVDTERMISHSAVMTNYVPRPAGAMAPRPGFERMGEGAAASLKVGFAFDDSESRVIEFRDESLRIWSGDDRVSRATQTLSITDGDWGALTGWTATTPGTTSAAVSSNELVMIARDDDTPLVEQQITVAAGTHAISLEVVRGPVRFRVGSTQGDDDIFGSTFLDTGQHELRWTSAGASFWIQFASETADIERRVGAVSAASSGDLAIDTPWDADALASLRWQQIGDRIYISDGSLLPRVLERRANESWSVVEYDFRSGPFKAIYEHRETLTPSATSGNITLAASAPVFVAGHVGALFQLTHNTQTVEESVSALEATTDAVEITGGSADDRTLDLTIDKTTGSFNGTITIERAFGDPVNFNDWYTHSGTSDVSITYDEPNDDRIVYVRARVSAYTSGSATVTIFAPQGETLGVARILTVSSSTSATAEVVVDFGDTSAVTKWREGEWSDANGWPAAPLENDGRLYWFSKTGFWASESDDFYNFDEEVAGDAAPLNRALGGLASQVRGVASLESRIAVLTAMEERTIQANDFGDIITRESVNVRGASSYGANAAAPVQVDDRIFYADRGGRRPMVFGEDQQAQRFRGVRLDYFTPGLFSSAISRIAAQRAPHTRIWYCLENGELYSMLYEPSEGVQGICKIEATGFSFLDVCVEPSASGEDRVWVTVQDGDSNVYNWRMFKEVEADGGDLNRMLDDAVVYESHGSATLTGLSHLDLTVPGVWADGADVRNTTAVSGGSLTLGASVTNAIAGRSYISSWKSGKIAFGAQSGTALTKRKRIGRLSVLGVNICLDGLRVGVDEESELVKPAPKVLRSELIADGVVHSELDYELSEMPGGFHSDPRILIRNISPNPGTVTGVAFEVEVDDN